MKKLTIKPFKSGPKLPDGFKEKTWDKLSRAVRSVYEKKAITESKEELYRAVEDLCMHKLGSWLYEQLSQVCKEQVYELVDGLIGKTSDQSVFLITMDEVWKEHCTQMASLRNIFLHLDRNFLPPPINGSVVEEKNLSQLGTAYFSHRLESRADLESALLVGLLAAVEADRMNAPFDEYSTKRLVRMLVSLGLYHSKFEVPFLIDTERFFLNEGQLMIQSCDPADFLSHAEGRIAGAVEMVNSYLDISTKSALLNTIESTLLNPHVTTLIEKGLCPLLEANRVVDLRRMYVLLDRVGKGEAMKIAWIDYVKSSGEKIVSVASMSSSSSSSSSSSTDKDKEKHVIEDLLVLYERMNTVLIQVFSMLESFRFALRGTWEYIVNIHPNKLAELLSKHLDKKLRAERGQTESDSNKQLDRLLVFFRYLFAKDVFEAFYRKLLSKRLLASKTASNDLEKLMITKLKTECGANYTSKLEGMLQDEIISEGVKRAFKADHKCDPDFEPKVLTVGYWPITLPSGSAGSLVLPKELNNLRVGFSEYYTTKYQGRRLVWANSVDRCLVTARLPKAKKELDVNLYQALCLLQFNGDITASLSYKEIKANVGLEDSDLRRTLQSLACGMIGTRVLTKEPKGKDVRHDDRFIVAKDISNKMFRINIKVIVPREMADEDTKRTHDEVFRDRQYQVDAIVVRIMKTRKRLNHTDLMGEILAQVRFPAQPADIKKRVESLIEREYLERDEDDSAVYNYLA